MTMPKLYAALHFELFQALFAPFLCHEVIMVQYKSPIFKKQIFKNY